MTSSLNWQDFLKAADLPAGTGCLRASNHAHVLIKVTGSDAESFLHAQLSNSAKGLHKGEVRFAAWCNAKGRVWTLLHYWREGDVFFLRIPADQADASLKRLRMFILRSDVQINELNLAATQFMGPEAPERSRNIDQTLHCIALPGAWPIHEIWSATPYSGDITELPASLLALPRIMAGIPEVFALQREKWIPQMLNLDHLAAIDFKKGCYPGQEIVAKLHYKGGLKMRMVTACLQDGSGQSQTEAEIQDPAGKKIGEVLESCQIQDTRWLTAVIRLENVSSEMFIHGQKLTLVTAPDV